MCEILFSPHLCERISSNLNKRLNLTNLGESSKERTLKESTHT